MMSSIPWRNSVPGAIRRRLPSRRGSRRGSSSEGVREKPRSLAGCLFLPSLIQPHFDRPLQRFRLLNADLATGARAGRRDGGDQAQLGTLLESPLRLRRSPEPAGEADLAEGGELWTNGSTSLCRSDGERDGQVGAR